MYKLSIHLSINVCIYISICGHTHKNTRSYQSIHPHTIMRTRANVYIYIHTNIVELANATNVALFFEVGTYRPTK